MKKTNKIMLVGMIAFFLTSLTSFAQEGEAEYSTIHFCRAKQGMMSGGTSFNIRININDKEITNIGNGTKISYKVYSEGELKIFCEGEFSGSPVGSPYLETINVTHGQEYCIEFSANMTGMKGKLLDEKKAKKTIKAKYKTEYELEEMKDEPLIEK